jgi:hypothetical protein
MKRIRIIKLFLIVCVFSSENLSWGANFKSKFQDKDSDYQIKLLNTKLIQSLKESDSQELLSLFSNNLKKINGNSTDELIRRVHPFLKTDRFSLLNDFQINNRNLGRYETINSAFSDSAYTIKFLKLTSQTHVSLILPLAENDQLLLLCVYGKYKDGWKLDILDIGEYKIFGKSPIDYYKMAKKEYSENNLIGAKLNMEILEACENPGKQIFKYLNKQKWDMFDALLENQINLKYVFPIKISNIASGPEILKIKPVVINQHVCPNIYYLSKIPLDDTIALRKENNLIQANILNTFPNINKNKTQLTFIAFNEIPDGIKILKQHHYIMKF